MKKAFLLITALAALCLLTFPVEANQLDLESDAKIIQTFCQNSELYAYVNIPKEKEHNSLIASALLDKEYTYKQTDPIEKVRSTTETVSYLFLIDVSTSMPDYEENIKHFVEAFMADGGNHASYALATFGKTFDILCDFTDDTAVIAKKMDQLQYDVRQTSLYSSLISALDYYDKKDRSQAELYNIVLITDGIEYDKAGASKSEVDDKIKTSSVMIHTFGLPTKSSDQNDLEESKISLSVLKFFSEQSNGTSTVCSDNSEKASAKEMIEYVNNLYLTKFAIVDFVSDGGAYPLKIVFAATGENGNLFEAQGTVYFSKPEETLTPGATSIPKATLAPLPTNTTDNNTALAIEASGDYALKQDNNCIKILGINIWLLLLLVIVTVLLAVGVLILLLSRRKSVIAAKENGIFMKANILSDNCKLKKNEFYLTVELLIGREKDCDIVIKNKDISKKNTRVYVRDNTVYIEDLNSTNGTSINNMRICAPNKLRSGDVISIGSVKFTLRF